jgi:hypothetical protein
MAGSLQSSREREIAELSVEETRLDDQVRSMAEGLSGLKDIDLVLSLARVKLDLCIRLMGEIARQASPAERELTGKSVTERAFAALRLVESLVAENISEDQEGLIAEQPLFAEVKARLQDFLLAGGGGFLEAPEGNERRSRILSRAVAASIRKFMGEDDRYPPLEVGRYPPFVQKTLLFLFPVLVRENPQAPPYGIEEGEEITRSSQAMKLPLSQAIFYIEGELMPALQARLGQSPGDAGLQAEIGRLTDQLAEYRRLRFFPRSTPVLLEKGFHTDGMTGYTADGEMLVPIPLPVTYRSGTNLDRKMELVRADLVKRIAGRGVSEEIDREYRHLKSLESGIRGNSRLASQKIDATAGFRSLRQGFPFLARLEDKQKFQELVEIVRAGGIGVSEKRIAGLIEEDREARRDPTGFIGISRTSPS